MQFEIWRIMLGFPILGHIFALIENALQELYYRELICKLFYIFTPQLVGKACQLGCPKTMTYMYMYLYVCVCPHNNA